jgi:hypothetical protein
MRVLTAFTFEVDTLALESGTSDPFCPPDQGSVYHILYLPFLLLIPYIHLILVQYITLVSI